MDILCQQHPKYNKNNIMECVLNYVVMFVAVYEMILVAVWDEYNTDNSDILWQHHSQYNRNNIMKYIAMCGGIFVAVYK